MKILIYQDYVHNNGVLHRRLCETYGHDSVQFCDADDISGGILTGNIFLFVMPGGADLFYCEKLNGTGNDKIRTYVEQGGNYLGICAGAYYAAKEIDWAKGDIAGPRELKFFDGKATGPVYEFFEDHSLDKSWQNIVEVRIDDHIYPVLYYGGPSFTGDGFGFYMDGKTAIVRNRIGKGLAILSSPHIEYRPGDLAKTVYDHVNKSPAWTAKNHAQFTKSYKAESDIWTRVLSKFER